MDLQQAQALIGRAVENSAANVPADQLALALATVLVRQGLLGATPTTVTLRVFGGDEG